MKNSKIFCEGLHTEFNDHAQFFSFAQEILFSRKFGPIRQNCLIKMKFDT